MHFNVGTLEAAKRSFYELGRHLFMGSYFAIRCDFCGKTKYIEGEYLLKKLDDDHYKCGNCVQREQTEKMRRRVYHERKHVEEKPKVTAKKVEEQNPDASNYEKYGGRIVVTMTSWKKRIGNCVKVIGTILGQTIKPDIVYLNLSSEEFKNKEEDLPKDLLTLRDENEKFIINWVDGENTKTMKKVFPVLQYLDDEDFIINTDDDTLMPKDLIESRMKEWGRHKRPIPACNNQRIHYRKEFDGYVCGPCSLIKKKMLNGWERICSDDVIRTYADDDVYAVIMHFNGYRFKPCETYSRHTGICSKKLVTYNDNAPLGPTGGYAQWPAVRKAIEKRLHEISGFKCIKDAYGFLRGKIDFIIPYTLQAKKAESVAMTNFNRLEIEYTLKSIRKFCPFAGRIFLATDSEIPEKIASQVTIIKVGDPYTHIKDANIINKLKTVIEQVPDLSDTFIMASDDQIVRKYSLLSDFKPRMAGDLTGKVSSYEMRATDNWHKCLALTMKKFPKRSYFYEPHIWSPMNKHKFIEMCKKYNIEKDRGVITQSLYYNFVGEPRTLKYDHTYLSWTCTSRDIVNAIKCNTRHLAWTDTAFKDKKFRDYLEKLLF